MSTNPELHVNVAAETLIRLFSTQVPTSDQLELLDQWAQTNFDVEHVAMRHFDDLVEITLSSEWYYDPRPVAAAARTELVRILQLSERAVTIELRIRMIRVAKEEAIDNHDFERAARAREIEKRLIVLRQRYAASPA